METSAIEACINVASDEGAYVSAEKATSELSDLRTDYIHRVDLLRVLEAWANEDDWGVPSIYISTVEELALKLADGVNPALLIEHASHTGDDECELGKERF